MATRATFGRRRRAVTRVATALSLLFVYGGEARAGSAAVVVYLQDGQLFTLVPGEPAQATGLRPDAPCGAAVGLGDAAPLATRDGRAVAYVGRGDLAVAALDPPTPPRAVTRLGPKSGVCVQLVAWSPDGGRLLYTLGVPQPEDGSPPHAPAGVRLGFHLWDAAREVSRPLPDLDEVAAWGPDADTVLQVRLVDRSTAAELRAVPLGGGPARLLARKDDDFAFGQLAQGAGLVAYITRDALWVAPLGDLGAARAVARGSFGEHQTPRISPDGRRLLWVHTERAGRERVRTLYVASLDGDDAPIALGDLDGPGRADWLDATRVLACGSRGLTLRTLAGDETPLAGPGACFVRRDP